HRAGLEIELLQDGRADLPSIDQLGRGSREQEQKTVERIGLQADNARAAIALAQVEAPDRLARRDVDDLDLFVVRAEHVEARAVLRRQERARDSVLQFDAAGK